MKIYSILIKEFFFLLNELKKLKKPNETYSKDLAKNKSTLTNSLIDTTNANNVNATADNKSQNFYRTKTISGVSDTNVLQASNTAVLFSNVRLQSHRREDFILPASRKHTGANRMDLLKTMDPSTTDDEFQNDIDDEQDDEDEDFYEETLKKNYAKSYNTNNTNTDLNNTRSSTLTSSSSCSSAFSSMSNLNSNQNEQNKRDKQNIEHSNENNQATVDLTKYLNNEDDDDEDDDVENDQASYDDAEDESFDEYLTSPAKTNANKKSI